ncbi:MAG TPA: YcdB/YcdC domain-containing protein [Clostridia bacterium]|nr:YcdB/YcdC domain-containing protein [Clostridia bacterium]
MKRIISIITLTVVLCGIFFTGPVAAAENNNVELKEAIEIAKTAFGFDAAKHDFTSSYSETKYGRKLWYLNWNSSVGSGSGISVTVDAATGEIINMSQWENTSVQTSKIPKHTRDEALKVAEALVKKLHPGKLKDTVLMDEYQNNLYRPVYNSDIYSFYYMRKIDGIDFQDNGIQVQIEKNTLKVRYFSLDWDTAIPIPDSKKAIGSEAAKKLYEEKLGIELAYQLVYPNPSGDPKLILVYTQKNSNNHIDAITGEIINQPYYGPVYATDAKSAMGGGGDGGYVPTPQEQKVIDDSSKYISKEKAIEALMKYLTADSKYKMDSSSLYAGMNNENATWSFSWSYNDKENNTYSYLYGSVDAVTSEVKSFSISGSENEYKPNTAPKYTKEQSREIAEKFLKELQPEKFGSSEYREQYYEAYTNPKNVSSHSFNYIRKEKGISAPFNSMNVTVSAYTGKVINFYMNWQSFEFPDASGTISLQDAYRTLYAKHDLKLKYARMYNYEPYNESTVIRLIYMPDNINGMIDARSGQFVDYNGRPIQEAAKVSFTDISGHKFEKDIKLLVELGILDSTESKFNPDSKVLQKDFVKLLMKAVQPSYYPIPYAANGSEYDSYYENAIQQGILSKEDKKPDAPVTRLEASKMTVKALGAGFVADLGSIFSLDLKDAGSIASGDKGYAAMAAALKLVDTTGDTFGPELELTRGEAAGMLVGLLKVEK